MAGSIIVVVNLKGGCGKTVTAVNVSCALAVSGAKVALVDADPQGTAIAWGEQGKLPVELHALPLADGKRALEAWLSAAVKLRQTHDFVFVDAPPTLAGPTVAALTISSLAVLPVTPSGMDLKATAQCLALVRKARGTGERPAALLVPSRVDKRTAAGIELPAVLTDFKEPVGPTISARQVMVDAFSLGVWIGDAAPRSVSHTEVLSLAAVVKRMSQ